MRESPWMTYSALSSLPRRGSLAIALLLLISACNGSRVEIVRQSNSPYAMPQEATRFFTFAYDQIADKYLQEVKMGDLADRGIANLKKLDSAFEAQSAGDRVDIRYNGATLGSFERPADSGDSFRWGQLTVKAIEAGRQQSQALRDADSELLYKTVVDGALSQLDRFSRYTPAAAARDDRANRDGFSGIGVTIDTKDGKFRISSVIEDAPAARQGVRLDDMLQTVDGVPVEGLEAADVVGRLRGRDGQPVRITVTRGEAPTPITFTILRARVVPPTVVYKRIGNVAHIRLTSFNQNSTESLTDAVRRAKREMGPSLDGVVLDLRGNLGGLLDQAISVSDLFLADGAIVSTRGRHRASSGVNTAQRGDIGEDVPLVVLINGNSASASEIVSAALEDNGRAILIGTTSFGKGSVQTVIQTPNQGELIVTWARFYSPTGYPIADLGVMPSLCTSGGAKTANAYIDTLRQGQIAASPAALAAWRGADHNDMTGIKELRSHCPAETRDRDVDLEVAQRLLTDHPLYAQVLQSQLLSAQAPVRTSALPAPAARENGIAAH